MINIDLETERLHYTPQLSLQSQPRPHLGLTAGLKPSADLQLGLEEETGGWSGHRPLYCLVSLNYSLTSQRNSQKSQPFLFSQPK